MAQSQPLEGVLETSQVAALLQLVVNRAPMVMWATDSDGRLTLVDGQGPRGRANSADTLGQSLFELYADSPDVIAQVRRVLNGEPWEAITDVDGHTFETRAIPLRSAQQHVAGALGVSIDVTERVRSERQKERDTEILRNVFRSSSVGIILTRLADGTVIDINPEYERMITAVRGQFVGRTTVELGLWSSNEDRIAWKNQLLETGEDQGTAAITARDGRKLYLRYWVRVVEIDGEACVLSTTSDVTEEVLAKRKLQRSRRMYRSLARCAPVGLFRATRKKGWNFVNRQLAAMAGTSTGELLGDGWLQHVHLEDRPRITAQWNQSLDSQRGFEAEFRWSGSADDESAMRWVLMQAHPFSRESRKWFGTATDITQRMKAAHALRSLTQNLEQRIQERTADLQAANDRLQREDLEKQQTLRALEASEAKWRALVEHIPDTVLVIDRDATIRFINRSTRGRPVDEVLGQSALRFVSPEFIQEGRDLIAKVFNLKQPQSHEVFTKGPEGEGRWFSSRLVPLCYGETVDSVLVSSREVTAHKLAELETARLRMELAHVARLNTAGELTAVLAHELNQPLLAISNYLSGCVNRLITGDLPRDQLIERLQEAGNSAERTGQILDTWRRFVRRRDLQREPTDLNRLVSDAIRLVQPQLKESEVVCDLHLEPQLSLVNADGVQVMQVMVNLLLNAVEAMDECVPTARFAELSTRQAGGQVMFEIKDHGRGLAPTMQGRIFEAFATTKPHGMGLGLSISRTIIESHEGEIGVRPNDDGHGVTFWFSLPNCNC